MRGMPCIMSSWLPHTCLSVLVDEPGFVLDQETAPCRLGQHTEYSELSLGCDSTRSQTGRTTC